MGSTSGTLAGESVTAVGALLGDTTPVPIAEAVTYGREDQTCPNTVAAVKCRTGQRWSQTFVLGLSDALVFNGRGLSFVLLVLQILRFLPPHL